MHKNYLGNLKFKKKNQNLIIELIKIIKFLKISNKVSKQS